MKFQRLFLYILIVSFLSINLFSKELIDLNVTTQVEDLNNTVKNKKDENLTHLDKPTSFSEIKQFIFENDFIAGTDEHYTNGFYFSWINDENIYIPEILDLGMDKKSKTFTISHMMFTPSDLSSSEPINTDIPYAGYLGLDYNTYQYNSNYFHEMGVTLGIVGRYAYAKELQTKLHKVTGNRVPEGWNTQLSSRLMPGLRYQIGGKTDSYDMKFFDIDLTGFAKFTLSELFTGSRIGWNVRIGNKLRDNFQTSGDFLGGLESSLLNYTSLKGFYWTLSYGGFVNKINHFYIMEASGYYHVDTIDYLSGDFFAYSIGYNCFDITFHMKTNYLNTINRSTLATKYGGLIVTWEF